MALLFADGFRQYADRDGISKGYWSSIGSDTFELNILTIDDRRAISLRNSVSGMVLRKNLDTDYTTLVVGFEVKPDLGLATTGTLRFHDGTQLQLYLSFTATGAIAIYNGDAQLLGTSSNLLDDAVWQYVEIKVTFHSTAGTVDVRVNGASWLSLTSVDTVDNSGGNLANSILLDANTGNAFVLWYVTNLYVCDDSGSINNDFLGAVTVDVLVPTSDASTVWAAASGANNYAMVDSSTPDETSYVFSSASSERDLYGYSNVNTLATDIFAIIPLAWCKKDNAGGRGVKLISQSSTINQESSSRYMGVDYVYKWDVFETSDGSAVWTPSTVNSGLFGVELE